MPRLRKYETCVVFSKVTKYPICMLAPTNWIYTNKVLIIGTERSDQFTICLSTFFCSWLENYSGGRRGGTLSLSINESVEKFPMPNFITKQDSIDVAAMFNASAVQWSLNNNIGLTGVMNAINSPECEDSVIRELRRNLVTIDQCVAEAYGWDDLDMTRHFYNLEGRPERNSTRFSISKSTRTDIVQRLLELNRQLYSNESKV